MKKTLVLFLAALTALSLTACSGSGGTTPSASPTSEETAYKTEIQLAFAVEPPTLDAPMSTAAATRSVAYYIYETLVAFNAEYQAVPQLCESYESNEDHTLYTFHLRHGVLFHNGEEMKADDVAASMNRWLDLCATGKSAVGDGQFEAVDDYTVQVQLSSPGLLLPEVIAGSKQIAAVMPAEMVASATDQGVSEYIGTGPYKLEEWVQNQYIHLTKFDGYTGADSETSGFSGKKEVYLNDVYINFVPDATTRIAGVQTGEYDVAVTIPYDNLSQFDSYDDISLESQLLGQLNLVINKKEGLLANEGIRKAVNTALDIDQIMAVAVPDSRFYRLDPSLMFQEQATWYSEAGSESYNLKDSEKAKQLLQEAGYNGETLVLLTTQAYPEFYSASLMIESQLEAIGMNVDVQVYDWATMLQVMNDPSEYSAFVCYYTPVATPTELMYMNPSYTGWTDFEEINSVMSAMNSASSLEDAAKLWSDAQQAAWDHVAVIKMGDYFTVTAVRDNVEGMKFFMGPLLWDVKVAE